MIIVALGTLMNFQRDIQPRRLQYSREFLIQCGNPFARTLPDGIPPEICKGGCELWKYGRRGGGQPRLRRLADRQPTALRERKRGRREGVRQRLRKLGLRCLPLPSVILGDAQSLRNKMDELQVCVKCSPEYKNLTKGS